MHLSPPFGHCQNHPYFWFSTASIKNLHTLSVVVLGFPCLLSTTLRSFSSSQLAMSSFFSSSSSSSRVSVYKFLFSVLRSTARSCENLHFLPFSHAPFLKNWHTTVLGSTPNGTFWFCTGLNSSAASLRASSAAFFSFSRCSFSASLRFWSALFEEAAAAWIRFISFCAAPPFFYRRS